MDTVILQAPPDAQDAFLQQANFPPKPDEGGLLRSLRRRGGAVRHGSGIGPLARGRGDEAVES
jgi:hypothetical protein